MEVEKERKVQSSVVSHCGSRRPTGSQNPDVDYSTLFRAGLAQARYEHMAD